jgi:hypothetical protein
VQPIDIDQHLTSVREATAETGIVIAAEGTIASEVEGGLLEKLLLKAESRGRDGCLDRGDGNASRAAFVTAVLHHPFGVGNTFLVGSPVNAFLGVGGDFHSGADSHSGKINGVSIDVGAFAFGGGTAHGVYEADRAARLHAVGVHPGSVLGTFTSSEPGSTSVAGGFGVSSAQSGSSRAFTSGDGDFTGADRAARFSAVGKHPVGVGGALRRRLCGPSRAKGVRVGAFGLVGRTEHLEFGFLFCLGCGVLANFVGSTGITDSVFALGVGHARNGGKFRINSGTV